MFDWLLLHTATTALLIAAVLLLIGVFRPGPAVRHALWLVVLLKMLTPPLVAWPWELPCWRQPVRDETVAAAVALAVERHPAGAGVSSDRADDFIERVEIVTASELDETRPRSVPAPRAATASVPWFGGSVIALWIAGGLVVGWRQAMRLQCLRRLLMLAEDGPVTLAEQARSAAAAHGIQPPRVLVLPGLSSPFVCGLLRAQLLWPKGLEEHLAPAGLGAVLTHEMAHLRRRDYWVGWLLLLGGMMWWWHPLFFLVRRRLGQEAELACDAQAAETTSESRRVYAEALVEVVERMTGPAEALPALGAASDRRDLERRIAMILDGKQSGTSTRRWLLAAGLLAALALPTWTLGRPQDKPEPRTVREGLVPGADADTKDTKLRDLDERRKAAVDQLVAELMKEFNALYKQGKYAEAARVAIQARAIDPDNLVVNAAIALAGRHVPVAVPPPVAPLPMPSSPAVPGLPPAPAYPTMVPPLAAPAPPVYYEPVTSFRADGTPVTSYRLRTTSGQHTNEVRLTRVTYKMPLEKAKAMAALLGEVKATVMEVKVDAGGLIVTTTPEAQETVTQLVRLLLAKPGYFDEAPRAVPPPPVSPPVVEPPARRRSNRR